MIDSLNVVHYRRLKDLNFTFESGINVIAGTNGTCKTSILYLISNSFQKVNSSSEFLNDKNILKLLRGTNDNLNTKVESLTRGDKEYNDPAKGTSGSLYVCNYMNGYSLSFRRHNAKNENSIIGRFRLNPKYTQNKSEKLPALPVVYLGLARLITYGESPLDMVSKKMSKLDKEYIEEVNRLYNDFTSYTIDNFAYGSMEKVKTRPQFSTDKDGIDSNTISSGEDNLFMLLSSLISLKHYYNSINSTRDVESILLIDELDATLHPAFQIKLLRILSDFSKMYKIQIFFTTHSMTLLEECCREKIKINYLIDNVTEVILKDNLGIVDIKAHLNTRTSKDIYDSSCIPIFSEDVEARIFINEIFDFIYNKYGIAPKHVFHLVEASIGGEALKSIFSDDKILKQSMRSCCVLDGDTQGDISNHIISLPGNKAPEKLLFDYSIDEYNNHNSSFFSNSSFNVINLHFTKLYFQNNIKKEIDQMEEYINQLKENDESTKGVRRKMSKDIFNKNKRFFTRMLKNWIQNNEEEVVEFYNKLFILFKKTYLFHNVNPSALEKIRYNKQKIKKNNVEVVENSVESLF